MEPGTLAVIFVVAGVILCVLELAAPGLVLLPFGIGAFVAAITGFFGADPLIQALVFLFASLLAFLALRPISKRLNSEEPSDGIGSRRLIGAEGVVLEHIPAGETGLVRIDREEWRAEPALRSALPVGLAIRVVDVVGTRVIVEPVGTGTLGPLGGPQT